MEMLLLLLLLLQGESVVIDVSQAVKHDCPWHTKLAPCPYLSCL
jgi:hypothetical protein